MTRTPDLTSDVGSAGRIESCAPRNVSVVMSGLRTSTIALAPNARSALLELARDTRDPGRLGGHP